MDDVRQPLPSDASRPLPRVLAVDDDEAFVFGLQRLLRRDGLDVTWAKSGQEALDLGAQVAWEAVLLDLGLPDLPGLEVLRALVAENRGCPIIVLSGRDEAGAAVEALRLGAVHYLTKPTAYESLLPAIEDARERQGLRSRIERARGEPPASRAQAIGESPAWLRALDDLRAAAAAPRTPVLLTGESGTGKEVAASQLHAWSPRADRPFVSVNAACLSPALLESELFGHEAGSFTGARGTKRGLFELADGGTLFLDEIGELPLDLQPKLLRVLEGHPFRRVGGEQARRADVRVVSATNRSLEAAVAAGRFRLDLYHRLRVIEVALPPLRERGSDAELLAIHFVSILAAELGKPDVELAPETLRAVRAHSWPGNVRELRNAIERGIVLSKSGSLLPRDLPPEVACSACKGCDVWPSLPGDVQRARAAYGDLSPPKAARPENTTRILGDVIRDHVLAVFSGSGGNLAKAARELGIGRSTLRRHLRSYGALSGDDAEPLRPADRARPRRG
jgi:DNA-binding NtrC family response regulator